ncbi:MAG TPA: sulfite exporter TauE/SafE family protein, partial [Candidatus Cloacimonadota bacterium]|nr:sulfite exporter TauE/SafE family protein [Candidatus Cloacimonadota bacterium]
MFSALAEGFALGLSTGTVCFISCAPIYLPWLLAEKKSVWLSLLKLMEISAGRFIAYILFGALAGYFGGKIEPVSRNLFTGISYILLSIFLLLNVFRTHREGKTCKVPKWAVLTKSAFLLGLFTGVNFCPSFLIALSAAVNIAGVVSGAQVFLGFFFGTSLFLMPLALSGYLTFLKQVKVLARIASVLIAVWFIWQGIHMLSDYYKEAQHRRNSYLLDLESAPLEPVLLLSPADSLQGKALQDSLQSLYKRSVPLLLTDNLRSADLPSNAENQLLILQSNSLRDSLLTPQLKQRHLLMLKNEDALDSLMPFLRGKIFRLKKGSKIDFT